MPRQRATLLAPIALALGITCRAPERQYHVAIVVPTELQGMVATAEVYVVTSCANVQTPEAPQDADVLSFGLARAGAMGCGVTEDSLDQINVYVRARDAQCRIVAAGCRSFDTRNTPSGALPVTLRRACNTCTPGLDCPEACARVCDAGQRCTPRGCASGAAGPAYRSACDPDAG